MLFISSIVMHLKLRLWILVLIIIKLLSG